ncbi:hypothetical protein [Hymenobacter terricola]|uniref:hypothetical protein n=1 Tax=Hymenobacter terricola TaxID=2819236 RepID=UPI001B30178B|nr:hypothetical protein [Hymenobacter terricola]
MADDEQPAFDDQPAVPPLPEIKAYGFLQEQAEQHITQAKAVEQYIEELRTDARYRPWFEQFHPDSVPSFIQHYALAKHRALDHGENVARWMQERITEYTDAAYVRLWDIQHKKLFDLQCQWRAGQLTLPKIDVSEQFEEWSARIHRCPFLEPISAEDFDLYCQFVATTPDFVADVEGNEYTEWQDYDEFKEEYCGDAHDLSIPEWYHYYNAHRGTAVLLGLPNLRGAKEMYYRKVLHEAERPAREQARAEREAEQAANPPDARPRLNYADQDAHSLAFARRFEPGKLSRLLETYQEADKPREGRSLKRALETLENAHDDVIEIEHHADWRHAVIRAAAHYRRQRLLEALPVVFEEYQTRQALGIAHPPLTDYESKFKASKYTKKQILKARALLGEPEDFSY